MPGARVVGGSTTGWLLCACLLAIAPRKLHPREDHGTEQQNDRRLQERHHGTQSSFLICTIHRNMYIPGMVRLPVTPRPMEKMRNTPSAAERCSHNTSTVARHRKALAISNLVSSTYLSTPRPSPRCPKCKRPRHSARQPSPFPICCASTGLWRGSARHANKRV